QGPTSAVILAAILLQAPVPPLDLVPTLPPGLSEIILKALEKDREDRTPSAGRMLEDLKTLRREVESRPDAYRAGVPSVRLPSAPRRAARFPSRAGGADASPLTRMRSVLLAASAAAALAAGWMVFRGSRAPGPGAAGTAAEPAVRSLAVLPF